MHLEIIGIRQTTLREVRDNCWTGEGFGSAAEFEALWIKLHPRRGFIPHQKVWLHLFVPSDTHTGKLIDLPFYPEMRTQILAGLKYLTTRTKKYGTPGDYFVIE